MKQRHGRPSKIEGKIEKYNALTAKQTRSLVAEYSTMTNTDLKKKYDISNTQFRLIVQQYKLKTKYVGKFTSKARPIEFFNGKCGVYAIVRNNSDKAYIGSSSNIFNRFRDHLNQLKSGTHDNVSLQEDWPQYKFYLSLIEECDEKDLLQRENYYLSKLDHWALYNTTFINNDSEYQKIWNKIRLKLTIDESGCWIFNGRVHRSYGRITHKSRTYSVHRVAYLANNVEFAYMVIHTCKNKTCCNPEHLISVSCKKSAELNPTTGIRRKQKPRKSRLDPYIEFITLERILGKTYSQIAKALPVSVSSSVLARYVKELPKREVFTMVDISKIGGVDI